MEDVLIAELKHRYESAAKREMVLAIHLFAIEYAEELDGHSINRIAEAATGNASYGTELRKGMRLSQLVIVKKDVG